MRLCVDVLDSNDNPIAELGERCLRPRCSDPAVQMEVENIRPDGRDAFEVLLRFGGRISDDHRVSLTLAVVEDGGDGAAGNDADGARPVCQSEAVSLRLLPGPSVRLAVVSPAPPHEEIGAEWRYRSGERFDLCVRAVDEWGNLVATAENEVQLTLQPCGSDRRRSRQGAPEEVWRASARLCAGSAAWTVDWRTRCSKAVLRVAGGGAAVVQYDVVVERGEWLAEVRLAAPDPPLVLDDAAGEGVDGVEVEVLRDDGGVFEHPDLAVSLRPPAMAGAAAPEATAGISVGGGRFRFGAWALPSQPGDYSFSVVAR
jgi:hypothetical protein